MRRFWTICISILLICTLALSLVACDFVDDILNKAQQIVNELELEEEAAENSGDGTSADDTPSGSGRTEDKTDVEARTGDVVLAEGDLSFHFLTLGNKYTGDSTYIKIGDVDILIDAGSRQNSAATIIDYVKGYCTDGKLEYVIATHAHQDHIAGFVGTKDSGSVLEAFEIGTIIQFAGTNATSSIYTSYCDKRDAAAERGAKVYTALDCWNQSNGAKRSYTLAEGVTMDILYQTFYENDSSDENNYSVCVLFNYGDNHYLFTGDLEEDGESSLVDNNDLPHCTLFKGGHHGSATANSDKLMHAIQPDIVCVCSCCGSPEYRAKAENIFPSQAFFDHVLPYTDQIFVTSFAEIIPSDEDDDDPDWTVKDMNGNIVVVTDGATLSVNCSASTTPVPYTDWFAANRTWPDGVRELYASAGGGDTP